MPVQQVRVKINNIWTVLDYNSTSGKYEGTIAAPSTTSYNVNTGHYYPVTVEATDSAGNVTTKDDTDATLGSSLKLTVKETTIPVITITAPTAGAFLATSVPTITVQLRDESNGSGIDMSTFKLQVDSGAVLTEASTGVTKITATNGYDVTYMPPTGLTDGSHTVKIDVKDYDGNTAVQKTVTFVTDTVAPTLSVTTPAADNIYVNNAAYSLVGVTSDSTSGIASVKIKLNGTDQGTITIDGSGNFTKALTLVSGVNNIDVTATDKAGKTTSIIRTINLDTTPPVISAVTVSPNPVNAGQTYTITVTVSDAI